MLGYDGYYYLKMLQKLLMRAVLYPFLLAVLFPLLCLAQEIDAPTGVDAQENAWLKIEDFEEMSAFTVAGPPTREDAEHAREETELYEAMTDNFDELDGDGVDNLSFLLQKRP